MSAIAPPHWSSDFVAMFRDYEPPAGWSFGPLIGLLEGEPATIGVVYARVAEDREHACFVSATERDQEWRVCLKTGEGFKRRLQLEVLAGPEECVRRGNEMLAEVGS